MAAPKRTKRQREADLVTIAELYLACKPQYEIAKVVGVSRQQIAYDLVEIREQWKQRYTTKIEDAKQEELAKIDRLEQEYWKGWEESKSDFVQTTETLKREGTLQRPTARRAKKGEITEAKTSYSRYGDPRFLQGIAWCVKARREILGMDAPQRVHVSDDDHEWSDEEIEKVARRVTHLSTPASAAVDAVMQRGSKSALNTRRRVKAK